jgi:hypothetical protein
MPIKKIKKKLNYVSSLKRKSVKEKTALINIAKQSNLFPRKTLEKIYKEDRTIVSLVKNSLYHYEMLTALQTQIMCLEAKIKILEFKIKEKENGL